MSTDLLTGLNPQQHEAVTAGEGPVLVLAGPGSGKTGVLTRRVAYLIREMNVNPWQIMAVTFTNKAAGEMKQRISNYVGNPPQGLQVGTFHSTCARILRVEHAYTEYGQDYVIYDSDDQLGAVKQAMGELNINVKQFNPRRIQGAISNAKNEMITAAKFVAQDYFSEIVGRVYQRYEMILQDSNAMDFDDLLLNMVLVFKQHADLRQKYQERFPFILVDEFQDTNMVQYQLVQLLAQPQNNIFVVGDEDQSIYAFRGADYRNVLRFREDYPSAKVVLLEQNYRSPQVVLDAARAVINKNSNRTPKALFTDRSGGEQIVIREAYDDEYEARFVMDTIEDLRRREGYGYNDFAVMYRTNAQSRAIEQAAVRMGIPHVLVGGVGFYKRREVRDLIAYLRVILNPDDKLSFARIINIPKRGIGKKSLQEFQHWATENTIGYGEALQRIRTGQTAGLNGRSVANFHKFGEQVEKWQGMATNGNLVTLFDRLRSDIGYRSYVINDISDNQEQAAEREENIAQLRGLLAIADHAEMSLGDWLNEITLMTDVDMADDSGNKVTLLTLHAAKGLEFPVVFITGVEESLIPHSRAYEELDGLEEERRLFYVGITRAEERLYLSYAFKRLTYGGYGDAREKSTFLLDIPEELVRLEGEGHIEHDLRENSYQRKTTWDSGEPNRRNSTSGLNRLFNDLSKKLDEGKAPASRHISDETIRGKIIPFPGGAFGDIPLRYKSGMQVIHPIYGEGTIIESKRVNQTEEVTIAFTDKRYGIKTMLEEYANLSIIDNNKK